MARPTLQNQAKKKEQIEENEDLFRFKLRICSKLNRTIIKARKLPDEQRYQYMEDYLQSLIEKMY